MPRSAKCRRVCQMPTHCRFSPERPAHREAVELTVEEYEALRLMDYLGLNQEEAAAQMGGGPDHSPADLRPGPAEAGGLSGGGPSTADWRRQLRPLSPGKLPGLQQALRPVCLPRRKGSVLMKIAVTYENGQVFQHFGHTAQFKLYDVENGTVASSQVVDTNGSGHGALAGFLKDRQVDALICGGIGGGAQMALAEAGIRLYAGCQGDADTRVAELLAGTLVSADAATCDHHHGEEHTCGDHGCGHHESGHTCGHC